MQAKDRLSIPRPCIDMRTVGYNVEWSQELTLPRSLEEYVKASMLVQILQASLPGLLPGYALSVFDMSLGYDLAGIRSERVLDFVRGLLDARSVVDRLRRDLPARWRDFPFTPRISGSVTLSTFHGCPPGEIEAIAAFLLERLGLDVTIKLNPTLLGRWEVSRVLGETLGYAEVRVPDEAFEADARWEHVAAMVERLDDRARRLGLGFGVKFSNTLVVENRGDFLPASEKTSYLSGPPLHALAMRLVRRFRRRFADRIPISFSAGIDRRNFPDAVALGLAPVTVCSDLLKPGGYGRLKGYLEELGRRMAQVSAGDVPTFVRRAWDVECASTSEAALRNTELYVADAGRHGRYGRAQNSAPPKKVASRLSLFDCLACDKCLSACPNGANFAYRSEPGPLALTKGRQIAHFADLCNECGNCDVFCPEEGAPYKSKPRFFGSHEAWKASGLDGFFAQSVGGLETVFGRVEGRERVLRVRGERAECLAGGARVELALDALATAPELADDRAAFLILDALRRGVLAGEALNPVNA